MMNGSGTLSDASGGFTYSGLFLDDDFDYAAIIGAEPSELKEMMPSLVQTVAESCFYLHDRNFGIAVRCSFAADGEPAAAPKCLKDP